MTRSARHEIYAIVQAASRALAAGIVFFARSANTIWRPVTRKFTTAMALSVCALPLMCAVADAQGAPQTAQFDIWWHSDAALSTFLQSPHPGANILTPSDTSLAPNILSNKYTLMGGLGGYAAQYAQGYPVAADIGYIEQLIDQKVEAGAKYIYVDEPWGAPGQSTATSAASIAYNVKGFNILYKYIHAKWPGVAFGLTIGDDGGPGLHLTMLKAGLLEDFSSEEEYNSCCNAVNPFVAQKAQFPNVKTMILTYNTETLCQNNGAYVSPTGVSPTGFDMIGFWDADNYGGWIGPWLDASWLQNIETFTQTGQKPFCSLPVSEVNPRNWTWNTQTANFNLPVVDQFYGKQTPQYKIASCDYMVVSGPNAINGPSDPSNSVTLGWTPRTCNGSITVTVGSTGNCRNVGQNTCLVFTRAKTSTGVYGNVTYQEYSIEF